MKNFIQFLTIFRIFCGPVIFLLILISHLYGFALLLFILASLTDFYDGYLARKYNLESLLGEGLDPIADKILICFVIVSLAMVLESTYLGFFGCILIAREFWVSALRDLNARNNQSAATQVTYLAKLKTTMQFFTIATYLIGLIAESILVIFLADLLLAATLAITIQTGLSYTIGTFKLPRN